MSAPPRIACIETSGRAGSIALAEGSRCLEVCSFRTDPGHALDLLPRLSELSQRLGWPPGEINQVYLSIGPGSFTGLRIAVTVGRTLAWSAGAVVVTVPTLAVIAQNALDHTPPPGQIGVILDAKRGQIFGAAFHLREGRYHQVNPAGLHEPVEFCASLPSPRVLLGEGIPVHAQALDTIPHQKLPEEHWQPRAEWVHRLGWDLAQRGEFTDSRRITPLYLRLPEAEEVWRSKHAGWLRNEIS